MPQEGVLSLGAGFPRQRGQSLGRALQRAGPPVVAHRVMPALGGEGVQIMTGTGAAVGVEVRRLPLPQRPVAFEHRQELAAYVLGTAHLTVRQQRPNPQRLPRQREVSVVIDRRALEVFAAHFQLRVIEEHFALAAVEQPAGFGLLPHPRHEFVQQLPQRRHTLRGLLAQPFSHLRLIGEPAHAEKFARQRIIVERLAVGETTPTRTQCVDQLPDNDLRAITAFPVLARIQATAGANLFPQAKSPGHCLDGNQTGVDGVIGVGDKLKFEPGCFLGDGRHAFQTKPIPNNSPQFARSKQFVMIRVPLLTGLPLFGSLLAAGAQSRWRLGRQLQFHRVQQQL